MLKYNILDSFVS